MKIYLVGGAVRDKLMNIEPSDYDYVVVGSSIDEMINLGFHSIGKNFPVFIKNGINAEFALARKEIKTGYKHRDFQCLFDSSITLKEDLKRRDFTCNAIAYDENSKKYIDYFNGINDIKNKILKAVDISAFKEDPLRVLRMCRFTAQLNFSVEHETMKLAQSMVLAGELKHLSRERIWNEIQKALQYKNFYRFIESAYKCFALKNIFPVIYKHFIPKNSQHIIKQLKQAGDYNEYVKFTILFQNIDKECIKNICKILKVPKKYCKFIMFVYEYRIDFVNILNINYDKLLIIIESLLNKPKHYLNDFVNSCLIINRIDNYNSKCYINLFKNAFLLIANIKATDMPNFLQLEKNKSFALEYHKYKLYILQKFMINKKF